MANDGVRIIVKIALQGAKNVTYAEWWVFSPKKYHKPKKSQPQSLQSWQKNVNQIDTTTTKSDDEDSVIYNTLRWSLRLQLW